MEFNYSYKGATAVENHPYRTNMAFVPDATREPTYFSGELDARIPFREAISALHDVVVSDMRFKPKDKTAYKQWAEQQDLLDMTQIAAQRSGNAERIKELQVQLTTLRQRSYARRQPFWNAQRRYFDYLYQKDRDAWFVLDPVITVHPDEVFFECFSQDESSYGRLSTSYEVFKNIGSFACGTTNIDYSAALYDEFQKIRSYKTTRFDVDPSGFEVRTTNEETFREVKIDLPDSWVRGFLQVSSAMSLPATTFDLHPMDVHDMCLVLRRRRERLGPRSMRFHLEPGKPVRIVFDPWGIELICKRSAYTGPKQEIRIWGRRRIHILERLIPIARSFKVHLLGQGMPSFWVADLGMMSFTLGLSGWSANDWSASGNFDLLAPRMDVDDATKLKVFQALKKDWRSTADSLAQATNVPRAQVLSALSSWTQAGRAIYDLAKHVYRARELSREPLPMDALRFANEREASAMRFIDGKAVAVRATTDSTGALALAGNVKDGRHDYRPALGLDGDGRIVRAECTCNFFQQNKLHKGPCEHMLAIRLMHQRQVH
ncbi:MAG: SWIM zinc finger family protein [Labilithrix sp.]